MFLQCMLAQCHSVEFHNTVQTPRIVQGVAAQSCMRDMVLKLYLMCNVSVMHVGPVSQCGIPLHSRNSQNCAGWCDIMGLYMRILSRRLGLKSQGCVTTSHNLMIGVGWRIRMHRICCMHIWGSLRQDLRHQANEQDGDDPQESRQLEQLLAQLL